MKIRCREQIVSFLLVLTTMFSAISSASSTLQCIDFYFDIPHLLHRADNYNKMTDKALVYFKDFYKKTYEVPQFITREVVFEGRANAEPFSVRMVKNGNRNYDFKNIKLSVDGITKESAAKLMPFVKKALKNVGWEIKITAPAFQYRELGPNGRHIYGVSLKLDDVNFHLEPERLKLFKFIRELARLTEEAEQKRFDSLASLLQSKTSFYTMATAALAFFEKSNNRFAKIGEVPQFINAEIYFKSKEFNVGYASELKSFIVNLRQLRQSHDFSNMNLSVNSYSEESAVQIKRIVNIALKNVGWKTMVSEPKYQDRRELGPDGRYIYGVDISLEGISTAPYVTKTDTEKLIVMFRFIEEMGLLAERAQHGNFSSTVTP